MNLPILLNGKTIVVTGGFGFLGSAVANHLSLLGATVFCVDLAARPAAGVLSTLVSFVGNVDLTQTDSAQAAIQEIASKSSGINALVNIAGGFRWERVQGGSLDTWDFLYAVNVKTAFNAAQSAIPYLRASGQGRIVNIGAASAVKGVEGMGAYTASKAAVARLTESLAEELKDEHITVNAVLPSIIDTPVNRKDMPDADFARWVQPSQIASLIAYLVSDDAAAVTGALIPVVGRVK